MQRLIHPAAASRNGAYFQGRVLAEPVAVPNGSAHVGPPELNLRRHFLCQEMDA